MFKQHWSLAWQFLVSVLFIGAPLHGREVASSGPELTIEVQQHDVLVTAPLDVYVTFTNVGDVDLNIEQAELIYPAAVKGTRDTLPTSLLRCRETSASDIQIVPANSHRFFYCVFPRYERSWIAQLLDASTFFFLPGKYRIQAVIEYSPAPVEKTPSGTVSPHRRFLRQTAEVELKPPLMALLRGSWLGCLLAALFLTIRWSGQHSALPAEGRRRWFQSAWPVVRFGFRVLVTGLVSATIIVLLLQRLSDIGLPLTVEVNDWVGGVIVGLVAYASTEALYRWLAQGDNTNSDNSPAPAQERDA
jgi:hypothetical protein